MESSFGGRGLPEDLQRRSRWQSGGLKDRHSKDMPEIVGCEKVKRVKAFHHREAFQKLEKEGLTMIPTHRHGVYLSFHQMSRTWQGFYPHVTSGLSYTFGGKTNRS